MGCCQSQRIPMINDTLSVAGFLSTDTFFRNMGIQELEEASRAFIVQKFCAGEGIMEQGVESAGLYCVAEGTVNFYSKNDGVIRKIRNMGPHEYFGEFGLIHNNPPTVSVDAVDNVTLLLLTRAQYEKCRNLPWMKNLDRWIDAAARSIVASGLRKIDFFADISESQLTLIGKLFRCEVIPNGSIVAREKEIMDKFYIVARGSLVVTTVDDLGLLVVLTRLGPGSTYGELSLLKEQPRNSSISTVEDSVLFSLGREEFNFFIRALPKFGEQIHRSVNERLTVTHIAERIPVFQVLSKRKLMLLQDLCRMKKYAPGEVIVREGNREPRKFFVISRGVIEISVSGSVVKALEAGAYFGELALVSDALHSCTATVKDDVFLLECSQKDFKQLFFGEPAILAEVALRVLGTRASLEDVLRHRQGRELFSKHIAKEFAKENIDFWFAVEKLESLSVTSNRKSVLGVFKEEAERFSQRKKLVLRNQAIEIFEQYIATDAPFQVNLSCSIVEKLRSRIEKEDYSFDMYSEAKTEIFGLMSKDNFARFQASREFKQLLNEVGITDTTSQPLF